MTNSKGSTDEAIGRPGPWKEGRYQRPGQSVDQSVHSPDGTAPDPDKRESTPVTRKDYDPNWDPVKDANTDPPGGDAG